MNTINTANGILHPSRLPEVRPPALSSIFTSHFIPPLSKPIVARTARPQSGAMTTPLAVLPVEVIPIPEEAQLQTSSPALVQEQDSSAEGHPVASEQQQLFEMFEEPSHGTELPTSPSYAAIFDLSPPQSQEEQELPPGYEESHQHDSIPVVVAVYSEEQESQESDVEEEGEGEDSDQDQDEEVTMDSQDQD
jgi:hypothetical protein